MEKHYNFSDIEKKIRQLWQQDGTYTLDKNSKKPTYSIDTPPPTVSGTLHIGHMFSYTQTDIIARYKRMSGYNVFYPFGFDDNGLPTERYVEKKLGVSGYKMGRSAFIETCLQECQGVEEKFKDLWQNMGLSVDWHYVYSTISQESRKISQESFLQLLEKNYVYRKHEPALYCTTCYTSVAQAELDDAEQASTFNDIVFKRADGTELVIGTTRPELLPSCVALLYNPNDMRYQHLQGQQAIVPLYNFNVPILADEGVEIEKGTGLVMCCTFGDKKDVEWYKKFKLPYKESIGRDGRWKEHTGPLAGLKAKEARTKILELLKEEGLLKHQKEITHSVNIHERCKRDIEIIEIPQWFVKILEYKQEFIKLADEINWYPAYMKSRYINWVENIGWDWCISRQRFFGIPFPIWYCQDCSQMIIPTREQLPVDPQETKPASCACGSSNIIADTDVMDTWNTSSVTPFICASMVQNNDETVFNNKNNFMPMGMRPQAHDIIRTWAFYTIVKSWMHLGIKPWNDIVISGHVLAAGKEKISKSKGNDPVAPENLLANHPADAIRFWTASGSLGQDIAFSDTQLKIGGKLTTKLWNAFKFCKEHIDGSVQQPQQLGLPNEWIMHQLQETFQQYARYFETNEFGLALTCVEKFFWTDFCDNYVEIIKNQLFNPELYTQEEVAATKWTLSTVGFTILQMYAPYMPFITEELYQQVYKDIQKTNSIHTTEFNVSREEYPRAQQQMNYILTIVEKVRKLKTEHQLSLKTDINTLTIAASNEAVNVINNNLPLIKGITRAQHITVAALVNKVDALEIMSETIQAHIAID